MWKISVNDWPAFSPLLDEALNLQYDDRALWLSQLRASDPELASHLEWLLDHHDVLSEKGFLEEHPIAFPPAVPRAGQTLGAYTLLSEISQRGMGNVWLAKRNDGRFERQVAVKFLSAKWMGKAAEERFTHEGRILGQLAHPCIADLIDAGVSAAGPYLILEYVEGDYIDKYCDQRKLDIHERIRIFCDVLAAVAHAHASLVVHRDLKPFNVLVRNDGHVKLLDFGIAKLLESENRTDESGHSSVEGGNLLTPQYAAPEQLAGWPITTATDVFAAGTLLYVLLTGQHPCGAEIPAPADLINCIVDCEPARMSDTVSRARENSDLAISNAANRSTTPRRLRRQLRGDLDTIAAKALRKSPGERYASITAFAEDLNRYLRNQTINARPDTVPYRLARFVQRNRSAVLAGSAVAVAFFAGGVSILMQARSLRQERDLALQELTGPR